MARVGDLYQIWSKRKAITAFFPFAVWQEGCGEHRVIDAFFDVARPSGSGAFMWTAIGSLTHTLFNQASPRTVVLASPHVSWNSELRDENVVARWAAAALEIPYTEEVGRNVVDTLLHVASVDSLRQQIPVGIWAWLNKRPPLPPVCLGRSVGTGGKVVRMVRELGNTEILESYFLLVWSEWDQIFDESGLTEMHTSIREDFDGIGQGHRRSTFVERLHHVLGQLDQGAGYLKQSKPWLDEDDVQHAKGQYEKLKNTALEVEREATEILTRTPSKLTKIFDSLTWVGIVRLPLDVILCFPSPVTVVVPDSVPNFRTSFVREFHPPSLLHYLRARFAYDHLNKYLQLSPDYPQVPFVRAPPSYNMF